MQDSKTELIKQRVIEEIKRYNKEHSKEVSNNDKRRKALTDDDLADWLNVGRRTIMRYKESGDWGGAGGKGFNILARHFGVRSEWLQALDNYRTDEDLLSVTGQFKDDSWTDCLHFLNSIGYDFKPYITSTLFLSEIRKVWNSIKDFLTTESRGLISDILNDGSDAIMETLIWQSCPDIKDDYIYKTDVPSDPSDRFINGMGEISYSASESALNIGIKYTVRLCVYKNGIYKTIIDISEFKAFAKRLINTIQAITDNYLIQR